MKKFLMFLFFLCTLPLWGVQISLDSLTKEIAPNETFEVNIKFAIPDGAYVYYKESGETGLPTKLKWTLPAGVTFVDEIWPKPEAVEEFGMKTLVYKSDFYISAKFKTVSTADENFEIKLNAEWLKCEDKRCTPQKAQAAIEFAVRNGEKANSRGGALLLVIFGAFAGGMILNLMPCVFPVIGLKIMSFAKDAASPRKTAVKNALLYALGIVTSFLALSVILICLKNMGGELGWGFQLQEPIFVALLIFLFVAMGLAFAGLFEIGTSFAALGKIGGGKGMSAFLSGVLAVIVASPCTAPFMASSLGFALAGKSGAGCIVLVFTFLGLGMAFPYVLFSIFPQFAKFLPKPGAWMEIFKQFLAFPLFASAVWLLWIFAQQAGADAMAAILFALLAFAFALWIFGKWTSPINAKKTRIISGIIALTLATWAITLGISSAKPHESEIAPNAWNETKVEELRKAGHIVYADFTASWCITCIANKKAVLDTEFTKELFEKNNVVLLKADWTNRDPQITRKLSEFGRAGVPLNIVYPADLNAKPIILPEILTRSALIEAIDKAR